MRPVARVFANGVDITGDLSDRLLSVEVIDHAEDKSDRCAIEVDDRPLEFGAVIAVPSIGTVLTVFMGYAERGVLLMGQYIVDQVEIGEPPATIRVGARSAAMPDPFRSPRTQSWHQQTLGDIFGEIAGRNGMQPRVDGSLSPVVVHHIDQTAESDMSFAARLAAKYDAVARPAGGALVVVPRGAGETAGGEALPTVTVMRGDCASWVYSYSARDDAGQSGSIPGGADTGGEAAAGFGPGAQRQPGGVRAYWWDFRAGRREEVTVGDEPFEDLRWLYHNESEARAAAGAAKNVASRGKGRFTCEVGGNPTIGAEGQLVLAAWRPYIPTVWRIVTVNHRYSSSGFVTSITGELFDEDRDDTAQGAMSVPPHPDDHID